MASAAAEAGMSEYELRIAERRRENENLLKQLSLDKKWSFSSSKPSAKPKAKKEKAANENVVRRRSTRLQEAIDAVVSYAEESEAPVKVPRSKGESKSKISKPAPRQRDTGTAVLKKGKSGAERGRREGEINGYPVGSHWDMREECSATGVHPPWVAGIYASTDGAYSVCLSAGYPEDRDHGDWFLYTGSGGRDLKSKNLRTGKQSFDQQFTGMNLKLKMSYEKGMVLRVLRGYKNHLGPESGYRYDGLYKITWCDRVISSDNKKHLVCQYRFERLPGQDPIDYSTGRDTDVEIISEGTATPDLAVPGAVKSLL